VGWTVNFPFRTLVSFTLFVLAVAPAMFSQTEDKPAYSPCSGPQCKGVSKADLFIRAFSSSGGSKSLRTSQLEQEEQVRLAFYGIDATRAEVSAGRLSEKDGQFIIDGHERVIRNYIHDKTNDAKIAAAAGQVSDIPGIRTGLGKLLSVARQDALMGREELAQAAQQSMVTVLRTFSEAFASTCQKQTFPLETAVELDRQISLMGLDINIDHCMTREFTSDFSRQGVQYHFETCSDSTHLPEKWKLKLSGRVAGEGKGEKGFWTAKFLWKGIKTEMGGEMEINLDEVTVDEEPAKVPNDAGPKARPNNWPSAPVPPPLPKMRKIQVVTMQVAPLLLIGDRAITGNDTDNSLSTEVKRKDQPCSPVTASD
jgi:hypothetical protein